MQRAKVSENMARLSHALLRSCSEKSAVERNLFDNQLETVNTATLTSKADQFESILDSSSLMLSISTLLILTND